MTSLFDHSDPQGGALSCTDSKCGPLFWEVGGTCRAVAFEKWLMLLAMLMYLLFSRTIDFSPNEVQVLTNSGSLHGNSGHPPGDSALATISSPWCLIDPWAESGGSPAPPGGPPGARHLLIPVMLPVHPTSLR